MALVHSFLRIARSKTLSPAAVHGRHVAFMNSIASQTAGAIAEVKPYEDIPGPKGIYNWPLIGTMIHFKPFTKFEPATCHLLFDEMFDKYGPIFKMYLVKNIVLISDPKDMETVFRNEGKYPMRVKLPIRDAYNRRNNLKPGIVDTQGQEWHAHRALLNKILLKVDSAHYYLKPQNAVADEFVKLLATQKMSPDVMSELFFRYAIESTGVVCFNTRPGFLDQKSRENKDLETTLQASQDVFVDMYKSIFSIAHKWIRSEIYKSYERKRLLIRKQTIQHIKDAQLVLETRKQNGTLDPDEPNFLLYLLSNSSLDFMDIVEIMDTLYIGGNDLTSKNLQTLLYNLAKNPDKQEILRKEIRSVLGDDGPVTGESLAKLPYLKACLKESFRLFYPSMTGIQRQLPKDVVLSGYTVPAGITIALHNPRSCYKYFSNADKFIPERWIRLSDGHHQEIIPPTAVLPFGSGTRNCIGKRFAEQEIYLATIKVLQKLKIDIDSDSWNVNFIYTPFIQTDKPIKFKFTQIAD